MNQQQKCVVITGGSRGLGLAIIQRLFEAGYAVATCSRHPTPELQALIEQHGSSSLLWVPAAIGDEAEEAAFFAAVIEWAGPRTVHALINNAAVAQDGILATLPNVDSTRIIEVNLLGSLRMSRLALRHMLGARRGGRIINISSMAAQYGLPKVIAYSASKSAIDGMTRAMAVELSPKGVRVNAIAPGFIHSASSAVLMPTSL